MNERSKSYTKIGVFLIIGISQLLFFILTLSRPIWVAYTYDQYDDEPFHIYIQQGGRYDIWAVASFYTAGDILASGNVTFEHINTGKEFVFVYEIWSDTQYIEEDKTATTSWNLIPGLYNVTCQGSDCRKYLTLRGWYNLTPSYQVPSAFEIFVLLLSVGILIILGFVSLKIHKKTKPQRNKNILSHGDRLNLIDTVHSQKRGIKNAGNKCRNCGSLLDPDTKFCINCGSRINH